MQRRESVTFALCIIFAVTIVVGCATDPQVMVTPFVLKPSVAAARVGAPARDAQPGTREYEQSRAGNTLSAGAQEPN